MSSILCCTGLPSCSGCLAAAPTYQCSAQVVTQLMNSCDARTTIVAFVRSTFMLMQRKWRVKITLAYRKANLLADITAKSAVDDRGTRICYDEPPQGAGVLLLADGQGSQCF
ncbi:hypothetical protein J1N35_009073 [Gossypium stocksii]|uniref:RNase H type-1 domain-containing protein n=1 Tax=Gossypium stocksii TaxID=47602 RepID=A0A9D4AH86_9ROSI|nr:hypothetical protein J1N35_009073 [Gossypium stocksii]